MPEQSFTEICELFHAHVDSLFLPAYALTASIERAEACLLSAVDLATCSLPTDEHYSYRFARRCIFQAAIAELAEDIEYLTTLEIREHIPDTPEELIQNEAIRATPNHLVDALLPALWELNPLRRSVLILRVFETYSKEDIASLLGISKALVEKLLQRGLGQFLAKIKENKPGRMDLALAPSSLGNIEISTYRREQKAVSLNKYCH